MFWHGIEVLFWRQIYGFKHRKCISIFSFIIPLLLTLLLRRVLLDISLLKPGRDDPAQGYLYSRSFLGEPEFFKFTHLLTVIATPENSHTSSLMTKVSSSVLQSQRGSSSLKILPKFTKSPEDMNRSLAESAWPSIGVEFHNVTKQELKYTLRPVTGPDLPDNFTRNPVGNDITPFSLLLQAAIDAAYLQIYFPGRSVFPKLQAFDEVVGDHSMRKSNDVKLLAFFVLVGFVLQFMVMLGMLILIIFLATYSIRDKLNGVRELLCVNGLPRWMVNTSWLFTFSLLATIIALYEIFVIQFPGSPALPDISGPVLFVYLVVYHWTATTSVYLAGNIITSQVVITLLILICSCVIAPFSWLVIDLEKYFVSQALLSLLPFVGSIVFWLAVGGSYSESRQTISLNNVFSASSRFISPGVVLTMMALSIFVYLLLGLYFDSVKPGPYGRARPWYLFTRKEKPPTDKWAAAQTPSEAALNEPIKDGEPIGLECVDIVKVFGAHRALNKVNLKLMKHTITVLLGHNGAGKTTLFSILSGMISPTSGEVFTDEYNIFQGGNINRFRSVLGYCPQENILMQELTVHEHLVVFGLLKGLVLSEAIEYSEKWTQMFDMYLMSNTQAKNLSGGSKRKLCLAIAMTGKPEYLLLDEPTAGLDVESTKKFCDILMEEKGNCTVVITTHNMDEAELLGERVAILAHGELKCDGSPPFLKKILDTGYRLNCSIIRGMSIQDAVEAVTNLIPGAITMYKTNHSVTFSLPVNKTKAIPRLLRELESQFGQKLSSSLSPCTLDDVYLKVHTDMGVKIDIDHMPPVRDEKIKRPYWNFFELFKKQVDWILSRRILAIIVFVILLPNLIMLICIISLNGFAGTNVERDSSQETPFISLISRGGYGFFILTTKLYASRLEVPTPILEFTEESKNMNSTARNSTKTYLFKYRSKVLFALDTRSDRPVNFSPEESGHDVSKIYSSLINAQVHGSASITTFSSPFMKKQNSKETGGPPTGQTGGLSLVGVLLLKIFYVPLFSLSCLFASSYFALLPQLERITIFKQLQLMTGLLPVSYWLANLVFSMLLYMVSWVPLVIIIVTLDRTAIFSQPYIMWRFILILFFYGLSSITHSYVWSFYFSARGWATFALILFNTVFPIVVTRAFLRSWPWIVEVMYLTLPYLSLERAINELWEWGIRKKDCTDFPLSYHEESCFYLYENPLSKVLKPKLIPLAVQAILWIVLISASDHGIGRKLKGFIARLFCGDIKSLDRNVDPEVTLERKRVKDMVRRDKKAELIVDGLGKNYGFGKTVVYDVTFAAERGECFGLVGVNGSGKTTTFGMLAALTSPTKGTAIIEGKWDLTRCEYNYIKRIGYCPQYNGLLTELSGRAILKLFAGLCGVPRRQTKEHVDMWLDVLDMTEIAERPCGQYSGGNKRKLSLAIALIGDAPVALLDEPTAGVDPVIRRRIWQILAHRLEQNQTIILTSHTMSECEAICDRLTIMVKGSMKCLGPVPTLKKTYGKRAVLEVKFIFNSSIQKQDIVKSKILSEFDGFITLEDRMLTRLIFNINTDGKKMHDLFATMLNIQSDYEVVEDFILVEAPLEQVFMMFAKPPKKRWMKR